jgi:ABC-type transport system substrate-binding protein
LIDCHGIYSIQFIYEEDTMKKLAVFLLVFLFALSSLVFTGSGKKDGGKEEVAVEPGKIEELKIGMVNDQSTTDMFKAHGVEGLMMKQLVYNGLVALDKNFMIVPGLAESWDISADGLEYTFHVRKGVKFHNGREMTTADIKWTYEKYLDPETGYLYKGDFDPIKKIDVVDDHTIKLTINRPNAAFLAGIASGIKPIMAKESYKVGEGGLLELDKVIGTGPYRFLEWVQEDHLTLEAFDDYWAGAPNVKKIIFQIVPDESVRLSALITGDLDMIRTPPTNDLVEFLQNPTDEGWALGIMKGTQFLSYNLTLNTVEGPFTDKRVRLAVMYAVDRDAYPKIITKGIAENAHGSWPKGNIWESKVEPPAQDLEKAKKLLAEAGYPNGLDITVLSANVADVDKVGEIAQAQLAKIGMRLNVEVNEVGRFFDRESKMDWDMKTGAHSLSIDPVLLWNLVLRTESPAWWWMGNYGDEEMDRLLDEGELETDLAKRQEIYRKVYQKMQDDAGMIWLHNYPITYGYRTDLVGIEFNTRGDMIFSNNQGVPWVTRKK